MNGRCGIQTSGLFLNFACGHFHEKIFSPARRYACPPVHREKSAFWNSVLWPLCDTSLESLDQMQQFSEKIIKIGQFLAELEAFEVVWVWWRHDLAAPGCGAARINSQNFDP